MVARYSADNQWSEVHVTRRPVTPERLGRLSWALAAVSGVFLMWLVWRYGAGAVGVSRLPVWLVDLLGLLTGASLLTLTLLWCLVVWQRLKLGTADVPRLTLAQLYALSPRAFEQFVAALFERRGYAVELRGRSGDLGVDLLVRQPHGRIAVVQCKRYRHPIGPDIVRELFGTMVHERAHHGFLVTTAEISDSARDWARDKPITLIDGPALVALSNRLAVDLPGRPASR